jgi:hypothetical protein
MHNTINSKFGPKPLIQADYLTGLAAGADSFWVGMPDDVVDQLALFRDNGMRHLVVGNTGALHPKLTKSAAAMTPYLKVLRRLNEL